MKPRLDISGTLDGVEWMPAFEDLRYLTTVVATVHCGIPGCGQFAGYRVVTAPGGLEFLIGSRAVNRALMSDEAAEDARHRRRNVGRHAGTWLGHVAIPLEDVAGGPVVLTREIRNAVPGGADLAAKWDHWLSARPAPRWATRLTADCGRCSSAVHVADVIAKRSRGERVVTTKPLPTIT